MDALTALTIIAIVFAVGDIVAVRTKAICSMMFVSAAIFLVGFWLGIPKNLFEKSALIPVSMAFISVLMIQMGSMLNIDELKQEWKTVVVALIGICAAALGLYVASLIVPSLLSKAYAIAAAGPISGGVVATLIMSKAAVDKHLPEAIGVFLTLLMVLQNFVGIPIASNCLLREGRGMLDKFDADALKENSRVAAAEKPLLVPQIPKAYATSFVMIAETFLAAWCSVKVAGVLNNVIHPFVMAMIFGIVLKQIGIIQPRIMDKANAGGMLLFVIMVPVFMGLNKASPEMVLSLIVPIVVAFVASVIGIVVIAWPVSKIVGYSWTLTIALSVPCLFGFPATLIISNEVAAELGKTQAQHDFILDRFLPKMLISGFTSVTIASVFLAGFLVKYM